MGAKPPNSVKAPLYTRDVPVERTPVGKISDRAAGATPTKLATSRHTMHCTMIRVDRSGSALSHRNSGSTDTSSRAALRNRLLRLPIRSDREPNQTHPKMKGSRQPQDCPSL